MKKYTVLFFLIVGLIQLNAQNISGVINNYNSVNSIQGCNLQLNFNEAHSYAVNDTILIIQMKGSAINTNNSALFGSITAINQAGYYEFNVVDKIVNSTSIKLRFQMVNDYNTNGLVQVVSVPYYSKPVVNAPLTCAPWDGTKGGILVFFSDSLTLKDSIVANGKGFRGPIPQNGTGTCLFTNSYFSTAVTNIAGKKGEGIFVNSTAYECGRGRMTNAGGGGDEHNSGGGGGAYGGAGGDGGQRYKSALVCPGLNPGIGGASLSSYFDNRLFLGGSGGCGHENNDNTSKAGNGGGIIIIQANSIIGNGHVISSKGDSVVMFNDGDGGSGGGSGGAILLKGGIASFQNFTLDVSGGNGQTVDNASQPYCCGAGGGGGGGVVLVDDIALPGTVVVNKKGGLAGLSINSTINCSSYTAKNGNMGTEIYRNSTTPFHFVKATALPTLSPNITYSKDTALCGKAPVKLFVNNLTQVKWTPNVFLDSDTGNSVTALVDSSTTYTVSGLDSCFNTRNIAIKIILDTGFYSPLKDTIICTNQSIRYVLNNVKSVNWSPNTYLNKDTGLDVTISPTQAVTYFLQVINNCGIAFKDTFSIQVLGKMQLNMKSDTICLGDSIQLMASGKTSYRWLHSDTLKSNVYKFKPDTAMQFRFCVVGKTNQCIDTLCADLKVVECISSIEMPGEIPVKIFPNPLRDQLNVHMGDALLQSDLTIMDLSQKVVYRTTLSPSLNVLPLDLINGVYLLTIQNAQYIIHQKIVVER